MRAFAGKYEVNLGARASAQLLSSKPSLFLSANTCGGKMLGEEVAALCQHLLKQALEEDPVVVDHVDVLGILSAPIRHLPQTFVQAGKVRRLVN